MIELSAATSISEEDIQKLKDAFEKLGECIDTYAKELASIADSTEPEHLLTPVELKRMIKREKNPMAKRKLQQQYDSITMWNGKHRRGKIS